MRFRWKWGRLALGLVAYWLVSTIIASIQVRLGTPDRDAASSIILTMVVFVIACMATERGQWKTWQRVGFVPLAWIVHALLTPLAALTLGALLVASGNRELLYRGIDFFSSIPVILYAAWRSRLFVTQVAVSTRLSDRTDPLRLAHASGKVEVPKMSKKGKEQKVITTDSFPSAGGIVDKKKKSEKKSKK